MLDQTFHIKTLREILTYKEVRKFGVRGSEKDRLEFLTGISYSLSQDIYNFSSLNAKNNGKDTVFKAVSDTDHFAIKRINNVLKKIYKVSFSNRNDILNELSGILKDRHKYVVIRADIEAFFDNVPRVKLIDKIKKDGFVGSLILRRLNELDRQLSLMGNKTLPRGLSISSTLSEIYLRKLDSEISSTDGVYYYSRYVDDIIIVCIENTDKIEQALKKELKDVGLRTNKKYKKADFNSKGCHFDYLGARFSHDEEGLKVSISPNKVKKIKTRIIRSITDYSKNYNDELLESRIRFLTGNFYVFGSEDEHSLKSGIYYNNQQINNFNELEELNTFLRKTLSSKRGSLAKFTRVINRDLIDKCMKNCFFCGYINKVTYNFSSQELNKIKRCWKDV